MINFCDNELIKLTFVSFRMAKKALLEYSCAKSEHTFSQHQFMALICLMKRLRFNHRLFTSTIQLMPEIRLIFGLKDIPHYNYAAKIL
jgi:hypothetical protein